ncbi:MAG: hypothetical protein CMA32_02615 [Euryarchaeota archaeon]|nr:hypothetical protein [Euryarchaeota archaeon]
MDYPWSNKAKEDIPEENEVIENEKTVGDEDNTVWDNDDPRAILLNILKLEGYKMDSGELFNAYREASGEKESSNIMESFKKGLDQLSEIGKIRSDSNGNIMTIQDYDREKSQASTDESDKEEEVTDETEEMVDNSQKDIDIEEENEQNDDNGETNSDDLESIIKLKEETDSWLIEKLKNNNSNSNETELREEVKELKQRIEKLEIVIKNITKAFE